MSRPIKALGRTGAGSDIAARESHVFLGRLAPHGRYFDLRIGRPVPIQRVRPRPV